MAKSMLLPRGFKRAGWILLIPTLLLGIYVVFHRMDTSSLFDLFQVAGATAGRLEPWLTNTLIIGIMAGSLMIACSREKIEDELIARTRLNALLLALYANYALLIVATLLFYDLQYLDVLLYNLFTLPLLFVAIYLVQLWRLKRTLTDEE